MRLWITTAIDKTETLKYQCLQAIEPHTATVHMQYIVE